MTLDPSLLCRMRVSLVMDENLKVTSMGNASEVGTQDPPCAALTCVTVQGTLCTQANVIAELHQPLICISQLQEMTPQIFFLSPALSHTAPLPPETLLWLSSPNACSRLPPFSLFILHNQDLSDTRPSVKGRKGEES